MRQLCSKAFIAPFLSGEFQPRTVAIPPSVMFEPAEEDFALLAAMRGLRGSTAFMPQNFLEPCGEASMMPCQTGFDTNPQARFAPSITPYSAPVQSCPRDDLPLSSLGQEQAKPLLPFSFA